MNTIGENKIWSYYESQTNAKPTKSPTAVRNSKGHFVSSFMELATKVAELQFRNPDFVLMFRGQNGDPRNLKENSTLKPSLFRSDDGTSNPPSIAKLKTRYETLKRAEEALVSEYKTSKLLGITPLQRHRILRWAVLQHYEICATPLLDVTHSLRIAASFASHGLQENGFLYVLAIPNLSGGVTASAEAGLQIIRLASVCPPAAVRPHIQEGYLLGEYPDLIDPDQKQCYGHYEIDFGRRLVAKFRFDLDSFWNDAAFPLVPKAALYPSASQDPFQKIADLVRSAIV